MYPSYKKTSQDLEFADAGLRFQSQIEENKLFIKVYDEMNVLKYAGYMDALPNIKLDLISKKLNEGKVEIQHRNENHLSINVMELIDINLESVSKKQKNLMQQRIKKLEERQNQYEKKIENQTSQIQQVSKFPKKLKQIFGESLKSIVQQLRLNYDKKIDQHANKIQQLFSNKMEIQQFIKQKKQILNAIEEHGLTIDNIKNKQLIQVGNLITELQTQIKLNSTRISSCAAQLSKQQNKINLQNDTIQGIKFKLQHLCKVSLNQSFFNQPTISSKWSYTLKSSKIEISQNKIKSTVGYVGFLDKSLFTYGQFCLLNASFSNTLKTKQSWAIKINKLTGGIFLGVCLKSKMQKYNFNSQNIKWGETGHGLYLIGSGGRCWSHSQKEFNCVDYKSFVFGNNDVICIEYDGVKNKLRFSKNLAEYFEMGIIAPPQNDAYHPCVALYGQISQVELIRPK